MKQQDIDARESYWVRLDEARTKARAIAYELRHLSPECVNEEEGTTLAEAVEHANGMVDILGPRGIGRPWASDEWKKANPIGGRLVDDDAVAAQRRFWRNSHGQE